MPDSSQDNRFSSSDSQGETTSWQPPLGLQQPLVTSNPLGQSFLSPQFLSPLGAQPLGGDNPLGGSAQALPDYNLSENFFQDSSSLAESRLSLNPPEVPITAATPTVGMDSIPVNIQRYPQETPTAHEPENNPIPAAPTSLSETERRLLGEDAPSTTEELQVAAPPEQLGASDTAALNPTVVQPQLATEPLLQREIAPSEATEAVEPSRESSVPDQTARVQIPEVVEEPPAIANANPSVMRSADLSNVQSPQTSPFAPLPSLPTDNLSDIEPIVSSQAELSSVQAIEPDQNTEPNTEDVPSVPVQRQEDEASPPSFVEPLPLPSQALSDVSEPPESLMQKEATADSPPPLNPLAAESPPAIAPVLTSDHVNVQPSMQPDSDRYGFEIAETSDESLPAIAPMLASDRINVQPSVQPDSAREAVAIAETSDLPPSIEGESATTGENLQQSEITPSQPTVVQSFSETESSALTQTTAAPLESPVLTKPERHQLSIINEPVADSSTPLATPELATITPSFTPTLEEPQQRTETPRLDTDTAPSHAEIVQPRVEREPSAQGEAAVAPANDAATYPEPLVSPASSVTEVPESPIEATSVAESELTIAQPFSEPESSESSEEVSLQDNEPSTSSIPTTPEELPIQRQRLLETEAMAPSAIAPTPEEAIAPADITSPTTPEASSIQRQPLLETEETTASAIASTHEEASIPADITSPAASEESSIQRQPLLETKEMLPSAIAPAQEEAIAPADIISPITPEASSIQTQPLLQTEETAPSAIAPTPEEASIPADITSPTTSEASLIQRQPVVETEETAPDIIAPTQEEAIAPADITSPTIPEASSIQRQPVAETEETTASAIAPAQEEASIPADITSPTTSEELPIQTQPLLETEETGAEAIAPAQEEASIPADITSPTTPEASGIQRQSVVETEEMAPEAIAPAQEEAIAPADITSSTLPEASGIQRQPIVETEETAPEAIAPAQEEAIAPADIASPTIPEEYGIQRQPLLETPSVDTASTASASEIELPSTINQGITTDSTLIMPKALPDEATPISSPTQPETVQPTQIFQLDDNTSLTEPIIAQPLLESDTNLQSERLPIANNFEEAQENSPQISPASSNSPALPAHLLQTKTNVTEDESSNQNQDIPQLPTVLENLVETRHTLPLIQPLNQQSSLLSTPLMPEFSTEQPTIVQAMPEASQRLVVQNTTPSPLPEDAFSQTLQSSVKIPPVSLDPEPLIFRRASKSIPQITPESNQETQRVGSPSYTSEVPSSWFSIADLLENTTTDSSSNLGGETPIQMAFDDSVNQQPSDWQKSNNWDNLIPEYSRHSDALSTFSQEPFIQKFTTEEPPIQDEFSAAEHPSRNQDNQDKDEQNLQLLAREIYSLVRQRLAIERERYGHYY